MKKQKRAVLPKLVVFLLRPFAGILRYGALKLMKKMRKADDKRPVIAASEHLLHQIILPSVFGAFQNQSFRELARFGTIPIAEHDRIFNELEVSGIYMATLYLNTAKSAVRLEDYHFWQDVEEHLPKQFQRILMGYGVDGANAKLVRQLIEARRTEYEELEKHAREINESENKQFKALPPKEKHIAAAIQAIAIGTTGHIRRGKMSQGDPLISHISTWLLYLQKNIGKFVRNL